MAANLEARVTGQTAEFQKAFSGASKSVEKFASDFEATATRAAAVGSFLGNVAANVATSFAAGLGGAVKDAVRLSQEFNNAFIGLGSVAAAFGQDVDKVKSAARGLSADGLLPLKDSATSLKNLLASGFGLDQSVKLISAFKDSAAFGRQSALSFGDAVRSATEGVKNGNSILVDNAGVTKNLSVILKEAGFQMQDLSDKVKGTAARQALYNGILRETAAQQGDAAKAAGTYTGQLTALQTSYDTLLATIGDAITQNKTVADAFGAVGSALRGLTDSASDNRKAFLLVSDGVVFLVRSFATLIGAIDTVQSAFGVAQVASNALFSTFAELGIAIFKFQEKAAGVAQFLDPVNAKRHAAAVLEARDAYTFLEGAVNGFNASSEDSARRQLTISAALQDVKAKATQLAGELEKTRGQVVDFGKSGEQAGKAGNAIAAGLEKAGSKAKSTATELNFVRSAIDKTNDEIERFDTAAMQRELRDLAKEANDTIDEIDDLDKRIQKFAKSQDDAADQMRRTLAELNTPLSFAPGFGAGLNGIGFTPGQIASFGLFGQQAAEKAAAPFRTAFSKLGQELPQLLTRALQQNNIGAGIAVVAEGAAGHFADVFREGLKRVKDAEKNGEFAQLTGKEIGAGIAAGALESFSSGFANGMQGSSVQGLLSSVIGGGITGATLGGGYGALVGFGAGLAGYLLGVADQADQERAQVAQSQLALLTQFHGIEALRKAMERAGFDFRRRGADPLTAETAEQFNGRIANMNASLDAYNEKLKAVSAASDALNRRTAAFGKQFEPLVTAKKTATEKGDTGAAAAAAQQIQELAQRTQPEFERISLFVRDTFAAIVRETGDAIGAINQLAPSFELLKKGITDFGLTSSTVIDSLVGIFDTVNNEAFKPFFENIQASGQLLKGLFDANVLSPETFQAVATDIGQSIQEIVNRGGDMAKALALSAPQLQLLWEAQQRYGAVTDQTTQSILDQAEKQGVIGAQFKSVNDKILDVLLAINKVLGGDIPASAQTAADGVKGALGGAFDTVDDRIRTSGANLSGSFSDRARAAGDGIKAGVGNALDGLSAKARSAATGVSNELNAIKAPSIRIPVTYDFNAKDDPRVRFINDQSDPRFPPGTIPFVPEPKGNDGGGTVVLKVGEEELGRVVLPLVAREAVNLGLVPR